MYYILTISTGQPLILYQENEKVYLYSVANGRISSKGLLFDDYEKDMIILDNKFIFYRTNNKQSKFFKIEGEHFVELFALPLNTHVLKFKEDVFIFYEDHNSLYCIKCSSYNKSSLILKGISQYNVSILEDYILLKIDDVFYKITSDVKVSKLELNLSKISELENKLQEKKKEISSLKATQKNITDQYNELASYAGKLQDELRKHRYIN